MIIITLSMATVLAAGVWGVAITAGEGCAIGSHDWVRGMCMNCGKVEPA